MARNKKFNKFLRDAARQGIYVGDINQASRAFTGGGYPDRPAPAAPPKPAETKIKGPEYGTRDKSSAVKIKSKGSRRRRQATQRGTSQLLIPLNTGSSRSGGLNV